MPVSKPVAFVVLTYAFAVVMLGTTMPTPVYSLYQDEFGFSILVITVIFAAYALGVLAALLAFGRWSDSLGRRPMLLAGIAFGIASAVVFITAGSLPALLVGRVLSGLSAGIFVGTATVTLVESVPDRWRSRAPAIATAANIGGLGLGPLLAGVLVQYFPQPLHTTFAAHIVLLTGAAVAVFFVPEPVDVARGARPHMQRLSVPAPIRSTFVNAATGGFAGFAVLGLFTGVSPGFMTQVLGIDNHAVTGVVVFVIFASSAAAQIGLRGIGDALALRAGCVMLIGGVAALGASLIAESLFLLVVAAVVCGVGQGMTFSKGMEAVTAELPGDRKAEVTSTFFVVLYIAISVPVIGAGAAARTFGLVTAGVAFSVAVAALATASLVLLLTDSGENQHRKPTEKVERVSDGK